MQQSRLFVPAAAHKLHFQSCLYNASAIYRTNSLISRSNSRGYCLLKIKEHLRCTHEQARDGVKAFQPDGLVFSILVE
jgi:hypothetical protein